MKSIVWPTIIAALIAVLSACSQPEPLRELAITTEPMPLLVGTTQTLELHVEPERFRNTIEWTSSNEDVALVDENGIVFGLASGTTTIRAAQRGNRALVAEVEVEVITGLMGAPGLPFTLEIDTNSLVDNGLMWPFALGLTGKGTIVVEWGDGKRTIHTNPSQPIAHTYPHAQRYTITVSGALQQASLTGGVHVRINPSAPVSPQSALRRVLSWGDHEFISLANAFESARSLTEVPDHLPPTVTDLTATFAGTMAFNQPLANWDTRNVTSMRQTFWAASEFNQPLNTWNTSNVTTMSQMFFGATAFNRPLNKWDTSKVTNMAQMFYLAIKFKQDLSGWCAESVPKEPIMFFPLSPFPTIAGPQWGQPCK